MNKSDFLVEAAYNLVGNLQNALCVRGELIYENIDWNKSVYTGTIPTKAEVDAEQQKLLDGEAMRRLRIHRDNLLKETDWVVTKANETGVAESEAWKTYRQKLRDLPATSKPELDGLFIKNVTFPDKP
jgi:hypothetical protein|tara:strand:+ start:104 stop:487 length:384 start_codon:yes stop_codon:yes gene_type:complete